MRKTTVLHSAISLLALALPAMAAAAMYDEGTSSDEAGVRLSAKAGLGYDDNVFRAPRNPYTNYALLAQPQVIPQKKSGTFVPYLLKAEAGDSVDTDTLLLGSASVDGRHYLDSALSNANTYNVKLNGGSEFVLARKEKMKDSFYAGALLEKHRQVYFDRANGTARTAFNRYNYTSTGAEAEYKHRTGSVDFGAHGKYAYNNFETPPTGSELDHTYLEAGADVDFPLLARSRMRLGLTHWTEDYSKRHARDRSGALNAANPLLLYTYDVADLTLHTRLSGGWRAFLDYGRTWRADGFVSYNEYTQDRYGLRLLYEQGSFKSRLALHHWSRNYPNAFAFDNPIGGMKVYSGNNFKLKAEWARSAHTFWWAELLYVAQNTTDLRYDYTRNQAMAGLRWDY